MVEKNTKQFKFFYDFANVDKDPQGAIQVFRNGLFLEIGPLPLITLITLNITPL